MIDLNIKIPYTATQIPLDSANRKLHPLCRLLLIGLVFLSAGTATAADKKTSSWNGSPSYITAIKLDIQDSHPNGFDWQGLARALIRLEPGDTLTREVLDGINESLKFFGQTQIDVAEKGTGVALMILFSPYHRIKSIDVSGSYPLFEKDVLTMMTIAAGDIFRPEAIAEQQSRIAGRYKVEGYIDPQVDISWSRTSDDGHYRLHVKIDKGPYYVLDQVLVQGNQAIERYEIVGQLKTYRTALLGFGIRRFVPSQFDKDIEYLTAYCRRQGYADVRIDATVKTVPTEERVRCQITIDEGARYQVVLSGNHSFSDFVLRKDLVLFKSGNLGNLGIRRSVQNIRRRYLAAGFADVNVQWESAEVVPGSGGPATRMITILIDEGRRHIVEQVALSGNTHFDEEKLRKHLLTRPAGVLRKGRFSREHLNEDLTALKALYSGEGYLRAQVSDSVTVDSEDASVRVAIQIDEGVQTRVGKVAIEGQTPVGKPRLQAKLALQPGKPYVPFRLYEDENRLAAIISEMGYPHVQVKASAGISDDGKQADITFVIQSGTYTRIGDIFFLGNFRTRNSFLKRELGLHSGDPFVLKKVLEGQRKLRDLNVFDTVQLRSVGLKEKADTVNLLVGTIERRPYYFELGGGYKTDTGFYGRAKLGDHNFLGTGKDLSLSYEQSEVGYRGEANLVEPRLLGTMTSANLGIYTERSEPFNQDFGTKKSGGTLNFSREWGRYLTFGLSNRYERRQQFLRDSAQASLEETSDDYSPRRIFVTTPAVKYDSRDSFIRPQNGVLSALSVDISKGLDNALDDFTKYRFDLRHYYPVIDGLTLAGRAYVGYLTTYSGQLPPQDQLFYLGGASTVRGYAENLLRYDTDGKAVGGRLAFAASLETRIDIGRNFELIPFVDTGSVQQALVSAGTDDFRWSVGMGLQYITPIGPMGVFYGFKIDPRPGESDGRLHISIGYTF